MKIFAAVSLLFAGAFACNHLRVPGEWKMVPHQYRIDSGYVEGKMQVIENAEVSRDWICPDSAKKSDSVKAK